MFVLLATTISPVFARDFIDIKDAIITDSKRDEIKVAIKAISRRIPKVPADVEKVTIVVKDVKEDMSEAMKQADAADHNSVGLKGRYYPDKNTLVLNQDIKDEELSNTTIHELGHWLDVKVLTKEFKVKKEVLCATFSDAEQLEPLQETLYTTDAMKALMTISVLEGVVKHEPVLNFVVRSLIGPHEAFARGFTQWVLEDKENKKLESVYLMPIGAPLFPLDGTWSRQDFLPVSKEYTALFNKLSWK
jgi:hypothetical protein